MEKMLFQSQRRRALLLLLALLLLTGSIAMSHVQSRVVPAADAAQKEAAARLMQSCMERIGAYKRERGLSLAPEDSNQSWMIGSRYTDITTTLGAIEAKRTTAGPDMAALMVQLLHEAGIQKGDRVGASFSGSFPGINLAVLCACSVLEVEITYVASVGASTYGATDLALTFPDMSALLVRDGLLPTPAAAFTWGGEEDCGLEFPEHVRKELASRFESYGTPLWAFADYAENIAARMALFDQTGIQCLVCAGGNVTTLGLNESDLGQGLLRSDRVGTPNQRSGLVQWYRAKGTPVINLLNIKKLCAQYNLPYDPLPLPSIGTSSLYWSCSFPKVYLIAGLWGCIGLLFLYRKEHRSRSVPTEQTR